VRYGGVQTVPEAPTVNAQPLPAIASGDPSAWDQALYRFLIRMGLVVSNPTDAVERPRAVQSVARGYTADEVRRLLAVVPETVAGRRDRAILLTLVLTGRRRAEVIGLRAGDLSLEGETVFYQYVGKGHKTGRRELPRPAYEAICASLVDVGKELASMEPSESLWQAAARAEGVTSGTLYARFRPPRSGATWSICLSGGQPCGPRIARPWRRRSSPRSECWAPGGL
jgi:integrase